MIANNFASVYHYSNQTWYQDVPLHHLSLYQISRQSDNPFPTLTLLRKEKKMKKLNQFWEVHISETPGTI